MGLWLTAPHKDVLVVWIAQRLFHENEAYHVGVTNMRDLTKVITIQTFISRASVMGSDPTKELAIQLIADY